MNMKKLALTIGLALTAFLSSFAGASKLPYPGLEGVPPQPAAATSAS
ncbi:hypothetical protein [Deinococcus petrolearius]|uniref:Uncharacterized protein n=1 Tax=Deinococcus petrolearius TaxID=1751295 RepID=A0ABW1DNL3_9DEIO